MSTAVATMIDAAERIAATEGLGAMSVRAVQDASGQRNKSAVRYHFGGRQGLIEAVVRARMAPINDSRTALLLTLDGERSVRQLVEVLVVPLAREVLESPRPSYWARFVIQTHTDPSVTGVVRFAVEGEAFRVARRQLLERLDHVPAKLRSPRLTNALGLVFLALSSAEATGTPSGLSAAELAADLVDTVVAVLCAPSTLTGVTASVAASPIST